MNKVSLKGEVAIAIVTMFVLGAGALGAFKIANAATTNSCIITLFGQQYDVTPLQTNHTGGDIFVCGTDMTATYQAMHSTDVTRMIPYLVAAATPTPSPTPTPTPSPSPTVTPSPSSSPSPTPTPSPTPISSPTVTPSPTPTPGSTITEDDSSEQEDEDDDDDGDEDEDEMGHEDNQQRGGHESNGHHNIEQIVGRWEQQISGFVGGHKSRD